MSFKDFKSGLQNVNEYLDGKHHLSGTISAGVDGARIVGVAEYSFTMRELMCGMLSGNGIKLPNLQIGLNCSLEALLQAPLDMQSEVFAALDQVHGALNDFMDHTKLDNVINRANLVLAEAQQVASLLNFCAKPIDPIAIPNMLERGFGSFLGPGQKIMNGIGKTLPGVSCTLCGQSFNPGAFVGGFLGEIGKRIDDILAGTLPINEINSLVAQAAALRAEVTNLINFENNITGAYDLGGSSFSLPEFGCKNSDRVGVLHNPSSGNVASNANVANSVKSLYDNLAGYPVQYIDPESGNVEEYNNIFELLFDDEILDILKRNDDPEPTVSNQVPIYDYCGNIKGFREVFEQQGQQISDGTVPESVTGNPGVNAGGFDTFETTGNTTTISNTTLVYNTTGGDGSCCNSVYIVANEQSQLSLQLATNDIVIRSDQLVSYAKTNNNTGTMSDFQPMGPALGPFLRSLNVLATNGIVVKNGDAALTRGIYGTERQVVVNNSTGAGGDFVVRLADNTYIPGAGSARLPAGNTLERGTGEAGRIRYNTDSHKVEAFFANINQWAEIGATGIATGGIAAIVNVGAGAGVFKQNNTITGESELRKINTSGAVTVVENIDDITIGESLTASNIGGETEVFSARVGNDFQFKTLVGDGNIRVTDTGNTVTITDDGGTQKTSLGTSGAVASQVLFNGVGPTPDTNESWFFEVKAIGINPSTRETRIFKIEGAVQNVAGTTALVGTPVKTDYQRSTPDTNYDLWDPSQTYQAGDIIEYDLKLYQVAATETVSPWENDPLNNIKWTLYYDGWNVTAQVVNNTFQVRAKGEAGADVNWKVSLNVLDVI